MIPLLRILSITANFLTTPLLYGFRKILDNTILSN